MSRKSVVTTDNDVFVDRIEPIGMLLWKVGVLVIGLRFAIPEQPHPDTLASLAQATILFQIVALALLGLALLQGIRQAVAHAIGRRVGRMARRSLGGWRDWLRRDWAVSLAVDC